MKTSNEDYERKKKRRTLRRKWRAIVLKKFEEKGLINWRALPKDSGRKLLSFGYKYPVNASVYHKLLCP